MEKQPGILRAVFFAEPSPAQIKFYFIMRSVFLVKVRKIYADKRYIVLEMVLGYVEN